MDQKFNKGDYVVVSLRDGEGNHTKRTSLLKVTGYNKGVVEGILHKDCHIPSKKTTGEYARKDVLINLGPDPKPGKVYNVDVSSLFQGRKVHDEFGPINFFYRPEKEVAKKLMKELDRTASKLQKHGLLSAVDPSTQQWEIHPYNGEKYAGMYRHSKDTSKYPNTFILRPESQPLSELSYLIHHEFAHHIHLGHSINSRKLDADWLRLYNTTIKPQVVKGAECQRLLSELLAQQDPPSAFASTLDEDDAKAYKLILKAISREHSLSVRELDLLWEVDYKDDFQYFWPKRTTEKDVAPVVSEYATKNVKELIAESLAFYMTDKKLPKEVVALVERTISYVSKVAKNS